MDCQRDTTFGLRIVIGPVVVREAVVAGPVMRNGCGGSGHEPAGLYASQPSRPHEREVRPITGTVVISLDAELAWGYHDEGRSGPLESSFGRRASTRVRQAYATLTQGYYPDSRLTNTELATARRSWIRLLDAFDEFDIPATWAIVGHLFLDECDGEHRSHPLSPAWFANDPGGTAAENRLWFGDGLIEAIGERSVDHEIGSHSFSHVEFGGPKATREVAAAELRAASAAADAHGLTLTSLVFPRNQVGHLDVLSEYGFTCYRGNMARWYDDSIVRPAAKATNMLTQLSPPPVSHPVVDEHGLVDIPASLNLFGFEGIPRSLARSVEADPLVRQVELGVERTIAEDGVFHLWFHPNDVQRKSHLERVRTVLAYIADRRDRNDIAVETMSTVAERTKEAAPETVP